MVFRWGNLNCFSKPDMLYNRGTDDSNPKGYSSCDAAQARHERWTGLNQTVRSFIISHSLSIRRDLCRYCFIWNFYVIHGARNAPLCTVFLFFFTWNEMGDVRDDGKDVEGSDHLLSISFTIAKETPKEWPLVVVYCWVREGLCERLFIVTNLKLSTTNLLKRLQVSVNEGMSAFSWTECFSTLFTSAVHILSQSPVFLFFPFYWISI